jgi:archaellum biogenesis protein FlaJ (TadC family)
MTFIEFKKALLDADLTIPKFCKLIEVSEKNIQAYKKKDEVPNAIASVVICFAHMNKNNIDYKELISSLGLKKKSKPTSGFANKMKM